MAMPVLFCWHSTLCGSVIELFGRIFHINLHLISSKFFICCCCCRYCFVIAVAICQVDRLQHTQALD